MVQNGQVALTVPAMEAAIEEQSLDDLNASVLRETDPRLPEVTEFEVYPSTIRSAIFNSGKTSRINVGHFMADLITENDIWNRWKGRRVVTNKFLR